MSRPWDGLVPAEDLAALEERGRLLDRAPSFGHRPVLVVVDMTRSFVDPGYPASCADTGGREATEACRQTLDACRGAGVPVVFTKILASGRDGAFLPVDLGIGLADKADLVGTPSGLPDGNEIADVLAPRADEIVLSKPKPSAFFGTALDAQLRLLGADSLIVVGMVTSGCVRATVVDAYMRNYPVTLVGEATADYSRFQHRVALLDMHAKYADLASVGDVVEQLGSGG